MNLLDSASLVVTANGYKASKLYSLIPADESGDFSVSRAGDTATRVNSSGVIETVLANKPRLDYTDGSCPKVLIEPQRTNLIIRSSEFDNAYWDKSSSTLTSNTVVSPDGTSNADTLNTTNAANYSLIRGSVNLTIATVYTASIFVKKSNYRYVGFRFIYTSGTLYNLYDFDTNTVTNTNNSVYPIKIQNYANGWVRLSITGSALATSSVFDIAYVNSNGLVTSNPLGTEQYYIWGAQVEAGESASSYIPTTSATVTRNGDAISKGSISSLLGLTQGTILFKAQFVNTKEVILLNISDNSDANKINIQNINSTQIQFRFLGVGGYTDINYTLPNYLGLNTYVLSYSATSTRLFVNGVLVGTEAGRTFVALNLVTFGIWWQNSTNIKFDKLAIWKTALTNSECITLSQQ
jgi:hypothetical protein